MIREKNDKDNNVYIFTYKYREWTNTFLCKMKIKIVKLDENTYISIGKEFKHWMWTHFVCVCDQQVYISV